MINLDRIAIEISNKLHRDVYPLGIAPELFAHELLKQLEQEGWQLVPKELTDDIWAAGRAQGTTEKKWEAILSVTPKPYTS